MKTLAMKVTKMKNPSIAFGAFICATAFSFGSLAHADESFAQDGQQYVLKSGLVGVIHKPTNDDSEMHSKETSRTQKNNPFFDVYDESALKARGSLAQKNKYRVVYKQVINPTTHEVTEVPAILTGDVIVQAKYKETFALKTPLKLKKSYQENGFYVYQLPADKQISEVLKEISKEPGVDKARVEIIEHLRVPM